MGRLFLLGVLQEEVFKNKQHGQYIHQLADLFPFAAQYVQHYIGNGPEGNAFGNAVRKGHGNDGNISGNRFAKVSHIDIDHGREHQEANDDQRRGCGKRRNGHKEGGET